MRPVTSSYATTTGISTLGQPLKISLAMAGLVMVSLSVYLALLWVPDATDFYAPTAQRIFYLHVASAWVSYLAFIVVLIMSAIVLVRDSANADPVAGAAAEIGIIFCTVAIAMGMLWGNQEWGAAWRWEDAKLTMTFVLWLVYIAYLTIRSNFPDEKGQKRVALYGIMAFVCVPLSFIASRIWQSLHPNPVGSPGGLSPEMGITMGFAVVALSFVFFSLLLMRIETLTLKRKIEVLKTMTEG